MTGRIDHAVIAREQLLLASREVSANWPVQTGEYKADLIALAQAHATLALVEQQRIANLIALGSLRLGPNEYPVLRHLVIEPSGENDVAPVAAIREGLGL